MPEKMFLYQHSLSGLSVGWATIQWAYTHCYYMPPFQGLRMNIKANTGICRDAISCVFMIHRKLKICREAAGC